MQLMEAHPDKAFAFRSSLPSFLLSDLGFHVDPDTTALPFLEFLLT